MSSLERSPGSRISMAAGPPGGDPWAAPQPGDPYRAGGGADPWQGQAWHGQPTGAPPGAYPPPPSPPGQSKGRSGTGAAVFGIFLVLLGTWFLFRDQIGLDIGRWWPAAAVALGAVMVIAAFIPRRAR